MTVGELKDYLERCDDDLEIVVLQKDLPYELGNKDQVELAKSGSYFYIIQLEHDPGWDE